MATIKQQEQILEIALEELRQKHSSQTSSYDQLRIKILAFITGELALVAFLFATGMTIPRVVYGLFFFIFGVVCLGLSFVILLLLLKSTDWFLPLKPKNLANIDYKIYPTKIAYMEHVNKNYAHVIDMNGEKIASRTKMFDISLMLLLAGVIILLVIKYGEGVIVWQNIIKH
jgi:hypothetical protein